MTTTILNKDCRTRTAKAARAASLLFAAGSILIGTINAQVGTTDVYLDSSADWKGWMVVGTNELSTAYPIGDLAAGFIGNVLAFAPNTSISRDFPATNRYWWKPDGTGAKKMDAVLYVNDDTLAGSNVTFSGWCLTNTLALPYKTNITAFIKEFNTNNWALITNVSKRITNGLKFTISRTTARTNHVEYGFEMVGTNASLSNTNLGWVVFSKDNSASVPPFPAPPQIVETSWKTAATTNAVVGSNLVLKATVVRGIGLTYQWQKNGVNLENSSSVDGATDAMLTLTGLQVGDEGTYTVVLSDEMGRTDNRSVYLIVLDPKDLPIDPRANWLSRVQRSTDGGKTYPTNQEYLPASDLKAVFTNGALSLAPNTKEYTNSFPGTNSDGSSKEYLSADYYVEYACLSGNELTFAGYCPSNSLTSGYNSQAWIKEFTPGYTNLVGVQTTNLAAGQKFEVKLTSTASTNLIQYGFSTLGLVANPKNASSLGKALISLLPPWKVTNVTVNPSTNWQGWMIVRTFPASKQAYDGGAIVFGTNWDTEYLDASFLPTNVLVFTPSSEISGNSPISATDPSWWKADGTGARQMDAIYYVNDDSMAGMQVTFSGYCLTNTLAAPYRTNITAFIKEFNADFSKTISIATTQMAKGFFSLTLPPTNANHVQYGFEMVGPNAKSSNLANLGWVVISSNANAVVPPVVQPANITGTSWGSATNIDTTIGATNIMVVSASGSGLTYQWQRNGVDLPEQTSATLNLSSVKSGDEGTYTLVVTDAIGRPSIRSVYLNVLNPSDLPIDPNAKWFSRVARSTDGGKTYPINQEYLPASDLKAVFTNGVLSLAPNTKEYTNSSPGTNSDGSSKEFLKADYYVEYACLFGKELTFAGYCPSNSLTSGYNSQAWIKEFTPGYTNLVGEQTTNLAAGQKFEVKLTSTASTNLIQYGFSTLGSVANPKNASSLGQALISLLPPWKVTNVTVNPSTNWHGWMIVRALPASGQAYDGGANVFGTNWDTEYLDASFLPTNILVFTPSSEISGNSPISATDSSWWKADGTGARQMDALYYVNDDSMAGKQVTFSGYCLTNTLAVPYKTNITAFIKEFNADFSEIISITTTQMIKGFFSLTLPPTNANHVQYGFEMVGPNAKSSNLANLGWVVISSNANAVVPPVVQSANITGTSWGSASNIDTTIGASNIMVVSVSGSGLTYQWQRNGVDLPEQTSATLNLGSVKSGDEGTYTLVVTDAIGRPSTRSVYLNVLNPSDLPIDPNAKWFSRVARSTDGGKTYPTNQEYLPASDLKAVFTNGVLSLAPNTKEYTNSSPGTNSDGSSKEFLKADYYVEYACLSGKELTFAGYCPSNSLTSGYNSQAWIKEFTPGYTNLVGEQTTNLAAGQKFEVKLTSTASTNLIQYGFSTLGLVANPVNASSLGEALISLLPPWKVTNVTVNPSTNWQGWMIVRALPASGQAYDGGANVFGTNWDTEYLDASFLPTNVLVFTPSSEISGNSPISATDPSWWNVDGNGARQMDAIYYVNDDSMAGKQVTFSGYCLTNTLEVPYRTNITAFIKEFNADFSETISITTTQMTKGFFSLTLPPTNANHVQYGFEMVGPNAKSSNLANLGWVVISSNANAVVPPVVQPANITGTSWGSATNIDTTIGVGNIMVVSVSGSGLTYQWQRNGVDLPEQTNATLNLSSVKSGDEGTYTLVVTDAMGRPSTRSVYLNVLNPSDLPIDPNAKWFSRVARSTDGGVTYWINQEYTPASDLKAVFTNGVLSLAPNTKEYTNSSPGTNSDGSSKEFLKADYYVEYACLSGKELTFAGYCPSNSLTSGYNSQAWIKEFTPGYTNLVGVQTTNLAAGQKFEVKLTSTASTNLIQYGFSTLGLVANPVNASSLGQALISLLPPWKVTNVTVDPSADWQGWMIARELPTVGQAYTEGTNLFSTSWAQNADLDARFLLTNVLVFTPNTVIEEQSPISANDPSWWNADGTGARQMDAIFYVSDDSLAGKKVTFSGYCLTNTLADPYSTNITAFIREFDADYSNIVAVTTTQMTRGYFSLVLQTAISTDSNHVQYGFEMVGPNASLENITNLGWVVISSNANAVVPPRAGPAKITATTWLGANIYTTVGTEITLEATASGRGLTYEWSKDGKILSTAGLKLYLSNVSGSDEGVYKLVVTDDMGNWSASSTYLVVFDPSHLTIEPNASWLSRVTRLTNSGIGADWIFKTNVEYALASDLRAGFTNGALKLAPNTKEYTNSSPGTNSDGSSREFLKAEYYIEYDRLAGNTQTYGSLAGKALTFAGYCPSNSLATGYTVYAFIKEAYHDYRATTNSQETKLVAGQAFILTLSSTSSTNLIQYGFRTEGQVANPLTASTLGQAFVYPLIVPSLTITRSLNNHNTIEINCPSMAGVDYIVEYKTDLSQTNWQTLGNWSDQVGMFTVLDNSIIKTAQQRYYRLSIKSSK